MQTREQLLAAADAAMRSVSGELDSTAYSVVSALDALRLTIAAAIAKPGGETFDQWAELSLMGHTTVWGRVREVQIGGRAFLEVTSPATSAGTGYGPEKEWTHPETTTIYSTSAVYSIEPATEERVLAALTDGRSYRSGPGDVEIPF